MAQRNACLAATLNELDASGYRYTVRYGKHIKVDVPALRQSIVVSVSSSDRLAPRKARSLIRRKLRQSGINEKAAR
jgi:hypothetical protein